MKILVTKSPRHYSVEKAKLLFVSEEDKLIINRDKVEWPKLYIKMKLNGKEFSFGIDTPRLVRAPGGLITNFIQGPSYDEGQYQPDPKSFKKVINSFAMIIVSILKVSNDPVTMTNNLPILDLSQEPLFILSYHPLGCPACSHRDNVCLQSSLTADEREGVQNIPYDTIKSWLEESGYTEKTEGEFVFKDYEAICDVYDILLRSVK